MTSKLSEKVKQVNFTNHYFNEVIPILQRNAQKLIGKKILRANGSVLKKYLDILNDGLDEIDCPTANTLVISVPNRKNVKVDIHGCHNIQSGLLGFIENEKFTDAVVEPARCNYTVDEILQKREKVKEINLELQAAKSDLFPFGEIDF